MGWISLLEIEANAQCLLSMVRVGLHTAAAAEEKSLP
jgi:hypothetical protein